MTAVRISASYECRRAGQAITLGGHTSKLRPPTWTDEHLRQFGGDFYSCTASPACGAVPYAPGCPLRWRDDGRIPEWALESKRLDALRAFLAAGVDVDAKLGGGLTPLMIAAKSGAVEVVRALIAAGASVDETTTRGETALMGAARHGLTDVVRSLLEAGADPRQRAISGGWRLGKSARDVTTSDEIRAMLPEESWTGVTVERMRALLKHAGAAVRASMGRRRGGPA